MLDICNYDFILRLHKQRYLCHNFNKKFFARTNIVDDECFISNQVKYAIALELKNKISEKDIAKRYRVSPNPLKELSTLITKVNSYIKIIYLKYYHLMNLNQ